MLQGTGTWLQRPIKLLPPAKAGVGAVLLLTSLYVHDDGGFPCVVQPHDEEGHLPGERQQRVSTPEKGCAPVLVLAGTELMFFLVAGIVLCFGFSMRIMLITH